MPPTPHTASHHQPLSSSPWGGELIATPRVCRRLQLSSATPPPHHIAAASPPSPYLRFSLLHSAHLPTSPPSSLTYRCITVIGHHWLTITPTASCPHPPSFSSSPHLSPSFPLLCLAEKRTAAALCAVTSHRRVTPRCFFLSHRDAPADELIAIPAVRYRPARPSSVLSPIAVCRPLLTYPSPYPPSLSRLTARQYLPSRPAFRRLLP
ncbi:hypothetical protein NL676_007161 [Syzygium grande]|nr:hypothetical protein NL676_007161 [Syzygium grande]